MAAANEIWVNGIVSEIASIPGGQHHADVAALKLVLEERRARKPRALVFYRAEVNEEEHFSEQYGRARSRVSYYILVFYNIDGMDVPHIAKVRCFVKLPAGARDTEGGLIGEASKLAICRLTRARAEGRLYVTDNQCEAWDWYALPQSVLTGRIEKLVVATPPADARQSQYFMTYYHMTDR